MVAVIVVFAGLGLAVAALAAALAPARPNLDVAVARFDARPMAAAPPAGATSGGWLAAGQTRLGRRLIAGLEARGHRLGSRRADLDLLGRSPERWAGRTALVALYGALLPAAAAAVAAAARARLPVLPPLLAAPLLAAGFWLACEADLRRAAAARRRDFTRALGAYLDLVAMSLAGGRGVPEALPTAAQVGHGWAFALIADTITRARVGGQTPWHALGELGERIAVPELRDLAAAVALVADDGARVRESITARAATLRRRQLTDAEGRAGQADQGMLVAQVVLAFGFLALILYPAAYQIFAF